MILIPTSEKKNLTSRGPHTLHWEVVVPYIHSENLSTQRDLLKKSFSDGNGVWVHITSPANFRTTLLTQTDPKSTWLTSGIFTLRKPTAQPHSLKSQPCHLEKLQKSLNPMDTEL